MPRALFTIPLFAASTFAVVPNTFTAGRSVVAKEVNENFTYLDTTLAKKADASSITSLQSSLNSKADQSAITSLQASKSDTADMRKVRDTVRTKVDQASLANALSPFAKKTYVDSATGATLASAIQANTASIPNIPGSQTLGQVNPDNLRNFESGISGADGPNKPWDWAVYQTLAPYAGGSIQLAGRHCSGCGSSYALRTKDDNNTSSKWSPWYSLWHSGNLTANTLPGGPYLPQAGGRVAGALKASGYTGVVLSEVFPEANSAGIVFIGYSGITGAANWALRGPFQLLNGIGHGSADGDLDLIKSLDRSTILATSKDGNAMGYVGIGTTTPSVMLDVAGDGKFSGNLSVAGKVNTTQIAVSVAASNVADYVFEPDYKLTSLSEVEAYTKQHKHLPEVPSATEIGKSGLDLAQMNLVLLKKVEELTLHAIAQQKALDAQTQADTKLRSEVAELKAIVDGLKAR